MTVIVLAEAIAMMVIPASAASWSWQANGKFEVASYNAQIVKDGSIKVDASLEDVYLKGTKITSYPDEEPYRRPGYESIWDDARGNFEAYVALDTNGMYIYAEIEDITIHSSTNDDGNDGDFFQIYLDWCTSDIVHPTPAEMYSMYNSGNAFNGPTYSRTYNVQGLQYIGYLSADYYGKIAAAGGFAPYDQLGPNGTDSVDYEAKLIDGGWACEWFIPWRDQEQKDMIKNGKQFHLGIGLQVGDDTDINNIKSGEKDVGICYDQRKEMGLQYWNDYTRLSDIVFLVDVCEHSYKDSAVLKEPTCMEIGQKEQTCIYCGATKKTAIPATGHTSRYVVCTVAKKRDKVCVNCGVTIAQNMTASVSSSTPESHVFAPSGDSKAPTCTEKGVYSVKCKYCGKTEYSEDVPANGHSYHEVSGKYICGVCGVRAPKGDANSDGIITNSDVLSMFRYIYNSEVYPLDVFALADINGDGEVTNSDVLSIFRYIYNPEIYPLEVKGATLYIDGADALGYTIVYPSNGTNGEKKFAENLAKYLSDYFEIEIAVTSSWNGQARAIVVGNHSSLSDEFTAKVGKYSNYKVDMNNATIVSADNVLWIAATNSYTMTAAVNKLVDLITPKNQGESVSVSFDSSEELVKVYVSDFGEELKIMTYNMQTGDQNTTRIANAIKNITDFDPDVIGTQELNYNWVQKLKNNGILNQYTLVGTPRNGSTSDTGNGNEYSAILFKTSKFNLIDSGTYWLSDTPTVGGTKHSSSTYIRIMTYAVLERKSDGKRFVHVNTHLSWDENGYKTNLIQMNIMLDLVETKIYSKYGELPTYFTGDFNVNEASAGYARMIAWGTNDSRYAAPTYTSDPTFSGGSTIDFCFVSKGDFLVNSFAVGYGKAGSDHYPVYIKTYIN